MSLKAGRVGVNPADVDPIDGHISPSSVDSYTKAQADAKFQPMTLEVPIKYLSGSVLGTFNTVQEALSGSYGPDGAKTNEELTDAVTIKESAVTDIIEGASVENSVNKLYKQGNVVWCNVYLQGLTAIAYTNLFNIPDGFKPKEQLLGVCWSNISAGSTFLSIGTGGGVSCITGLSNNKVRFSAIWFTS